MKIRQLVLASAVSGFSLAAAAEQPSEYQGARGAVSDDSQVWQPGFPEQGERQLPNARFTIRGADSLAPEDSGSLLVQEQLQEQITARQLQGKVNGVSFASGYSAPEQGPDEQLEALVRQLAGRRNIRMRITGHTDNQRLSAAARQRYGDNRGLGLDRAHRVGRFFMEKLNLPAGAISYGSQGAEQPVASNETAAGMAKNRRVEVQVWYDEVSSKPEKVARSLCGTADAGSDDPFRISVDGQPREPGQGPDSADKQRCTDVALEDAGIQLQYDNLARPARLNVSASERTYSAGEILRFQGYSNYRYWIERAEVLIVDRYARTLATVALNEDLAGGWQPAVVPPRVLPRQLFYQLRVYDSEGRYDETELLPLRRLDRGETVTDDQQAGAELAAGYGENRLSRHRIPVEGGVITVNGRNLAADHRVLVMGKAVPVDARGGFVTQQIVPRGLHQVEIAVLNAKGEGRIYRRDLRLPDDDWFTVALADITVGRNKTSGPAQLVNGGDRHYDEKTYADGRLAFYTKGKINGRYTVTASGDTGDQELKHLFSNIDDKNPRELLRRMDATRHWPVFGDDSTLVEDAPTQGKFFARIEEGHSHVLWGNFKAEQTDTELAQVDRALYGAQARYRSDEYTASGEHRTRVDAFAAEPGTLSAREDFRGTGGSVFFLRHQDITTGSERVRIEVRDKDSDQVLQVTNLAAGSDYDIDSIQGRILLSSPLSSVADDRQLVQSGSLSGHPAYLVVNYEYTPGFTELSDLATSARVAHWVNDNVKVGVSVSSQEEMGETQDLAGVDLTLRKSADTWLKLELANSDGAGLSQHSSDDGGFDFDAEDRGGREAGAGRVEGAFSLSDLTGEAGSEGQGTFYLEVREDGFSAPGRLTSGDTDKFGGSFSAPLTDTSTLTLKLDDTRNDGNDQRAVEVDVSMALDERWTLGAGLRADEQEGSTTDHGERQDLAVQLKYTDEEDLSAWGFVQGTLHRDGERQRNHRAGVGSSYQLSDRTSLKGEISGGDMGLGARAGIDYQWSDRTSVYTNYQLDNDRTDNGVRSRNGQLVSGVRSRWTDSLSVYAEGRKQIGSGQNGLMQAYGIDYAPNDRWSYGFSLEHGDINQETDDAIERTAITGSVGFHDRKHRYAGGLEYRDDDSSDEDRTTWLWRNNYSAQVSDDWRAIVRLDLSISESDRGDEFDGDFAEASLGYAWRPVDNDRVNALLKYTYLYDLAPPEQLQPSDSSTVDYAQRSQVFSGDLTYDLSERWSVGGKYAYRLGELRPSRDSSADWFDSEGQLLILRADWHVVHAWDVTLEWRRREEKTAEDSREGMLLAGYRHFGQNFKLGVGYNFSDFSDDLTDMDYEAKGWFINAIGKY